MFAYGIIFILAGGFCVFKTEWFIITFPVLTIIYGVVILMTGIGKVQLAVDMLRRKNHKWFWAAINAVVSIICAIIILNNPFTSTAVLWIFTGVSLLVEGVLDIVILMIGENFKEMTDEEVNWYIDNEENIYDCAGYSMETKASLFVTKIEGDYKSIVGLPISRIYSELKKLGYNINDFEKVK